MREIRAILFDFDGTILNSSVRGSAAQKRFFEVAEGLLLPITEEHRRKTAELWGAHDPKRIVAECWPGQDFEVFVRMWCRIDMHPARIPLLVYGAQEALRSLKRAKFFLGILTDRDALSTSHIAAERGIATLFERIWTRDDLPSGGKSNPKSPEKVVEELERRGIARDEILFIGDSRVDLECARAARLQFLGVLSGFSAESDFLALGLSQNRILSSIAVLPHYLKTV